MKYRVQFGHSWQGQWEFEANHDVRAWETARDYINEHTQIVYVTISEIWELDSFGSTIRKLDNYEEYFIPYKIYFENGDCILNIDKEKDDFLVWNEVRRTIEKLYNSEANEIEIYRIEQLERVTNAYIRQLDSHAECKKKRSKTRQKNKVEEQKKEKPVMFRAHFSDGQCTGPYIAKNDKEALQIGKSRAKFHAEYIKIPANEIKIIAIDEIEMFKPTDKGNNWYIKTPLTMIRIVDLNELIPEASTI